MASHLPSLRWLYNSPAATHHEIKLETYGSIDYFLFGTKPRLFISSGIHGDEAGVIPSVSKAIQAHHGVLPSFIYVPIVSPSAVELFTRKNKWGQDVNRGFIKQGITEEARAIMTILTGHAFDLSISFHEDIEYSEFYLFDDQAKSAHRAISPLFARFVKKLKTMNVGLFTGIDDTNDPTLGYEIKNGYRAIIRPPKAAEDGQLESWMISHGICKRILTPELPSSLPQPIKDKVVDVFISDIVLPLL